MNCINYRRLLTSDPAHRGAEAQRHRLQCRACAEFGDSMQAFDRKLRDAMMVQTPPELEARVLLAAASRANGRRRRVAIAAGALVGLAVSFGLFFGAGERESLQASVIEHVYHEPELLSPSPDVIAGPQLAAVLEQAGIHLVGNPGEVSYAGLCYFRGHLVPHMVVKGDSGPVTVLVLRNERVKSPVAIAEEGFRGTILPVRGGSIAVVGRRDEDTDTVQRRVVSAIEWET